MHPSVVFSASLSAHSRSGLNIFLNVRRALLPSFPPLLPLSICPPPSPSPSEKSCVLSGTNSRDKKGLNESRTATSEAPYADLFFLFVSHSRAYPFATNTSRISRAARWRRDVVIFEWLDRADGKERRPFFFFFGCSAELRFHAQAEVGFLLGVLLLPDWFLRFDDYVQSRRDSMVLESNNRS